MHSKHLFFPKHKNINFTNQISEKSKTKKLTLYGNELPYLGSTLTCDGLQKDILGKRAS